MKVMQIYIHCAAYITAQISKFLYIDINFITGS